MRRLFNSHREYYRFLFFILFLGGASLAQETPVRYGVRAGLNLSKMDFSKGSPPPEFPVSSSYKEGGVAGLLMIVPLAGNFYIQPEYLYSQMPGKSNTLGTTYYIDYLSLPVFLRWETNQKFALLAGPEFGLLINAKQNKSGAYETITKGLEDRSVGATFGMEIEIIKSVLISTKYMLGLNHIGSTVILNNQEFKFEAFQFSVVYIL